MIYNKLKNKLCLKLKVISKYFYKNWSSKLKKTKSNFSVYLVKFHIRKKCNLIIKKITNQSFFSNLINLKISIIKLIKLEIYIEINIRNIIFANMEVKSYKRLY